MDYTHELWELLKMKLAQELSEIALSTWFDEVEPVAFDNKTLVLCCPSEFKRHTVRSLYAGRIAEILSAVYSSEIRVEIISEKEKNVRNNSASYNAYQMFDLDDYTFEAFVVGENNKLAYHAANALARQPSKRYNPLLIHGSSGMGKSHLLRAIAHETRRNRRDAAIIYVKACDLTNELISAIKEGGNATERFRAHYRDVDVLLVDDIQFLAGKKQTQEEFFNLFNTLFENGKAIALASDRPPKDMPTLDERLRSRFEGGIMVDIEAPDLETRKDIIRLKAKRWKISLSEEVIRCIAESVQGSVRSMEGAVNRVAVQRELLGREISVAETKSCLQDYLQKESAPISVDRVIEQVARYYRIDPALIRGRSKKKNEVRARNVLGYLLQSILNMTTKEIGEVLQRDHSTISYSLKRIQEDMIRDKRLKEEIEQLHISIEHSDMQSEVNQYNSTSSNVS